MSDNEKHKSGSGTESNDSASDSDSSSGSSEDGEYSSPEHSKRAVTSVVVSKTNIPNPRQLNNKKGLQEDDDESDHITTRSDDERQEKELEERRRERMERHRLRDEKDASRSKDEQNRNGGNERHRSRSRSNEKRRSRSNDRKRRSHSNDYKKQDDVKAAEDKSKQTARQKQVVEMLTSRTGGAYIPPAKLRLLQAEITDKSSAPYQRIAWEALKKSIHGYINKVNVDNIGIITRELLTENIIRGRGLLTRSIIQAQAASPTFTHVYAALVAIINSKFPNIGELLLQRLVIQFKRGFRRNDKMICLSSTRFIAHLVNQRVAHEILSLEILTLLVESPTDDSVEVAIAFLKECGQKLTEVSSKGVNAIFEMLKNILHEGKLDKRVQYMIEVVFQVRKDGFKDHIAVIEALELVEEDDQFTHLIMLDEATDSQDVLNVFKFDEDFETNENKYKGLSKELLGSDASDSEAESGSGDSSSEDSEAGGDDDEEKKDGGVIIDNTETNLVALRRTIYLTIHSSLDYEECAHKLMKMELKPGQEIELCHMFLDCCAEQRTYEKFYGLLAQRFCNINKVYVPPFEEIFKDTYHTTHRLDTNRLRNVSKFFAHLLFTDAIGWDVMDCIQLNEEDTTSSSRIFIKILFQELVEYMSLSKLNARLKDATLQESFSGLFPRDNPRNTRFAINFFTSIGLGGLTDELREHLKKAPKQAAPALPQGAAVVSVDSSSEDSSSDSSSSSDSESDSDDSSSSSSSDSSDSSSSSDNENRRKKKTSKKKKSASSKNDKKKKSGSSKKADFNKKKLRMDKKDKHKKKNRKNDEVPVRNQEPAVKRRNPFGDRNEMRQMSPSIEMQWGQRNQNAPAPKKRQQRDEHQRSPSAENLKKQRGNRQRSQSMENNRKEQPGSFVEKKRQKRDDRSRSKSVEKKRKQRQRSPSVEKKRKNQRDESPVAKKYQSRKYNDYSRSPSVEKRNRKQRDSPVMEKRNRRDQYDDHSRSRSVEKKSRKQQRDERPRSLSSDDERQRRVERYADNRKKDRNEKRHYPEERSRDDSPPTARKQKRRSRSVERNRRHYDDNDEDRHDRRRVSKERG